MLREAANKKRKSHGAAALELDSGSTGGEALQGQLDDLLKATTFPRKEGTGEAEREVDLPESTEAAAFAGTDGCQAVFYKFAGSNGASDQAFMTEPLAVSAWYGFAGLYDYEKGTNIYPEAVTPAGRAKIDREAHYLKGLLWRSYKKVSFAVSAPWVVGRFCPTSTAGVPAKKTAVDNVENVNPICDARGYNACYNKMALTYHNEKRALREGTGNLELDEGIAKFIQAAMDKTEFMTLDNWEGKLNKGPYAACGESTYEQETSAAAAEAVEYNNEASKSWHDGESEYDATTGERVQGGGSSGDDDEQEKRMKAFTRMVWKRTRKVGFGVKGGRVIAWYCDVRGS